MHACSVGMRSSGSSFVSVRPSVPLDAPAPKATGKLPAVRKASGLFNLKKGHGQQPLRRRLLTAAVARWTAWHVRPDGEPADPPTRFSTHAHPSPGGLADTGQGMENRKDGTGIWTGWVPSVIPPGSLHPHTRHRFLTEGRAGNAERPSAGPWQAKSTGKSGVRNRRSAGLYHRRRETLRLEQISHQKVQSAGTWPAVFKPIAPVLRNYALFRFCVITHSSPFCVIT